MIPNYRSTADVIIRTPDWDEAVHYYEKVMGFPIASRSDGLVGFDTGAFRLYVERGVAHGPVFEYLVDDVAVLRDSLVKAGCTLVEEDAEMPRCYLRDPHGLMFNLGRRR